MGLVSWFKRSLHSSSNLMDRIVAGDRLALSKAITLLESVKEADLELADKLLHELNKLDLKPIKETLRLGITGAPGVGKSTFIEKFGKYLIANHGKRLAILTVDPSSARSGGSILGDKTRMLELSTMPEAFIRSSPNRLDTGGVITSTMDTIRIYARFNTTMIESVGVGQSELALANLVDIFVLIVTSNSGDELQGLKRGITEIADLILVNKADSEIDPAANQTILEYQSAMRLGLGRRKQTSVLPVSGRTGRGMEKAWQAIMKIWESEDEERRKERRLEQQKKCTIYALEMYLKQRLQIFYSSERLSLSDGSIKYGSRQLLNLFLRQAASHDFGGNI